MSETRTRIKICGITNREDALAAIDYGADALGFIYVPDTLRFVGNRPDAHALSYFLPPFIARVAVCADLSQAPSPNESGIDTLQLYSVEALEQGNSAEQCFPQFRGLRILQAFRVRNSKSLEEIDAALLKYRPHALLLDTYHEEDMGGSGKTFDWEIAREAKNRFSLPIILAGGLNPENVAEAIAAVRPYAVDVSSGVEAEPGRKDHAKLRAFIQAVRSV